MGYIKREPRFGAAIGRVIGHRYDGGGKISQQKTEARGVTEFNTGGSHEENKYGGIPQGVAPDGAPNLVEEGEVKLKDIIGVDNQYILSNRIMLDAEHAEEYGIPQSVVGLTYAAAFKKLYSPLKERSGNIEVKNEIAHLANAFMEAQDSVKAEQEARQMGDMMQAMPPEALAQMAQAAQGQQTQQPMPPQGAPPEAMGQGMQPGMEQMPPQPGMEGQGMPPEMMQGGAPQGMPQGMPPEAMQGGVDPSMTQQAGGMPMMARGGRMRTFAKGGRITTNRNNMFQGIFEHRYDEGGKMESRGSSSARKKGIVKVGDDYMSTYYIVDGRYRINANRKTVQDLDTGKVFDSEDLDGDPQDIRRKGRSGELSDNIWRNRNKSKMYSETSEKDIAGAKAALNKLWSAEGADQSYSQEEYEASRKEPEPSYRDPTPSAYAHEYLRSGSGAANSSPIADEQSEEADDQGISNIGEPSAIDEADARSKGTLVQSASNGFAKGSVSPDADLDDLVRRTLRGEFGNGAERKKALGNRYSEVQRAINQKYSSKSGSAGTGRGDKAKAAIGIADVEGQRKLQTSGAPSRTETSSDTFQDIPPRMGGESSQPRQGGDYFNNMSDEDLSSLVEHLTALLRSRQQGGRPGDTDEMDEILAKTEGRGGY